MTAKKKTVLKGFDYMHCDDFAKYLSDMAAKGWHFKEWGAGLKFEQGEPEHATYAVEVFTKASENDMRPEPKTQEFAEYCEAAGWKFMDAKQKFCIFKQKADDAIELFTPEERITNAYKGMCSGSAIMLLVLYGINAILQWVNLFSFFERNIFSATFFFSFSIWNLLFLGQISKFGYAFVRKRQLLKEVQQGAGIYIGTRKNGKWCISMRDILAGLLLLFMMVYLLMLEKTELILVYVLCMMLVIVFSLIVAKVRPDSNTNFLIQLLFTFAYIVILVVSLIMIMSESENDVWRKDELPMQISDYRECSDEIEDVDIYRDRNLFGSYESYFIFTKEDSIYYQVYRSEHDWILDKIWEDELDARFNEGAVDCAEDWGAQRALRNKNGTYYVRFENDLLVFSDDDDVYLSKEQIEIICEKLKISR